MGTENRSTFCSLSDSLEHGPCGIWAHLKPVLDNVQRQHDMVDTVHFISDGPTPHYQHDVRCVYISRGHAYLDLVLILMNNPKSFGVNYLHNQAILDYP